MGITLNIGGQSVTMLMPAKNKVPAGPSVPVGIEKYIDWDYTSGQAPWIAEPRISVYGTANFPYDGDLGASAAYFSATTTNSTGYMQVTPTAAEMDNSKNWMIEIEAKFREDRGGYGVGYYIEDGANLHGMFTSNREFRTMPQSTAVGSYESGWVYYTIQIRRESPTALGLYVDGVAIDTNITDVWSTASARTIRIGDWYGGTGPEATDMYVRAFRVYADSTT